MLYTADATVAWRGEAPSDVNARPRTARSAAERPLAAKAYQQGRPTRQKWLGRGVGRDRRLWGRASRGSPSTTRHGRHSESCAARRRRVCAWPSLSRLMCVVRKRRRPSRRRSRRLSRSETRRLSFRRSFSTQPPAGESQYPAVETRPDERLELSTSVGNSAQLSGRSSKPPPPCTGRRGLRSNLCVVRSRARDHAGDRNHKLDHPIQSLIHGCGPFERLMYLPGAPINRCSRRKS